MAKLTQFGRMRRRIKRELEAARITRAMAWPVALAQLQATSIELQQIRSTVVTAKMLAAWKRERAGETLPDDPPCTASGGVFIKGGETAGYDVKLPPGRIQTS